MYSERRKTWNKSVLASAPMEGKHKDAWEATDESTDSFYRAPMSRQSSNESRFFAGSTGDSSRRPSRSRSRQFGDSTRTNSMRNSTELLYANPQSLGNSEIDARNYVSDTEAYIDLGDNGQPEFGLNQQPAPSSGKVHSISCSSTSDGQQLTWDKPTRPPRGQAPGHGKSESASTSSQFETALSHNVSTSASACASLEGYVTPPQTTESSHVQRFRIANPSPPSPPPPLIQTSASRRSMNSHKDLPVPPAGSDITSNDRPSTTKGPEDDEEPESYFVRNTYAQLDVTGVKGDGYEDGVERTRAKLGHDRRSVQLAAVNNAKDPVLSDIPEKELTVLSNVDRLVFPSSPLCSSLTSLRYGFFSEPSHERVVILHSNYFAKNLQRVARATTTGPPSPVVLSAMPKPPEVPKDVERRRIVKWSQMLESEKRDNGGNVSVWRVNFGKEKKLRSRVFKGIPDAWRAAAWEVLIGRWVGKQHGRDSLEARELERMLTQLRTEYRSSVDRPSSYDVQIDLDVPRTINGHVLFKTRYGQG